MRNGNQSREIKRAQTLDVFFNQNTAILATFPPFAAEVKDFNNNLATINTLVPNKDVVTAGITQDKSVVKQTVADELDIICKSLNRSLCGC